MNEKNEKGYYYLHTETHDLIFKRFEPEDDSPFVQRVWDMDLWGASPDKFLEFLTDAFTLGASRSRILELYNHNKMKSYVPPAVHEAVMNRLEADDE